MTLANRPVAYICRLSFDVDLTKPRASSIPLGVMIEAVWPDRVRWLGLIGRTELTKHERTAVNFTTWPELAEPFDFLERLFKEGWKVNGGTPAGF